MARLTQPRPGPYDRRMNALAHRCIVPLLLVLTALCAASCGDDSASSTTKSTSTTSSAEASGDTGPSKDDQAYVSGLEQARAALAAAGTAFAGSDDYPAHAAAAVQLEAAVAQVAALQPPVEAAGDNAQLKAALRRAVTAARSTTATSDAAGNAKAEKNLLRELADSDDRIADLVDEYGA